MGHKQSKTIDWGETLEACKILDEKQIILLTIQDVGFKITDLPHLNNIDKDIDKHINELDNLLECKQLDSFVTEKTKRLIDSYKSESVRVKQLIINYLNEKKDTQGSEGDQVLKENSKNNNELSDASNGKSNNTGDIKSTGRALGENRRGSYRTYRRWGPPKNNQIALLKTVPSDFETLNKILEKDLVTSSDIEEVVRIRKAFETIRNMFVTKIDDIYKRYEDNMVQVTENEPKTGVDGEKFGG